MADTDQEKLYVTYECILELLKTGSDNDFEKLKELCEIISKDLPYLETNNDVKYEDSYTINDTARQRLKPIAKKTEDLHGLIPVETVGDGSCLFRALSFLCFGHQNRHRELRVGCIIDMALYSDFYLKDKELLGNAIAEANYIMETNEEDDHSLEYLVEDFYNVVLETCNGKEFAKSLHIQALADILKRNIEVIYSDDPRTGETGKLKQLKSHFNCKLGPEQNKPPLKIMWMVDREHFVPLISKEVKEEKDSGLGASLNVSENNGSIDHDIPPPTPVHQSTPKKASRDQTFEEAKVKKEESEDERVDITRDDAWSKLEELFLQEDETKMKLRKQEDKLERIKTLTGPYQMADPDVIGILEQAPIKFITKLIEVQFKIKWKTDGGRPERFNFYDFCNVERLKNAKEKTVHLKYDPRRAHVFTELYRKVDKIILLRKQAAEAKVKRKEFFCPRVYVKVNGHGWYSIQFSSHKCEKVKNFKKEFSWMHKSLREFVADVEEIDLPQDTEVDYWSITEAIAKPTLYWAVLEDTDFRPGDHLELHGIGKTQVYVGKANGGIMRRWIKDDGNHSRQMEICAEVFSILKKSFHASILNYIGIQLVDARLLLARIKKERHAVFLIQTFEDKDELEKAEKKHREGKRFVSGNVNIVPHKDIRDTWTPKKMEFGMNKL